MHAYARGVLEADSVGDERNGRHLTRVGLGAFSGPIDEIAN